ncbi:NAD-binding domain 4 protein [Favolaschia claudopus]|uniref:Fatty acyl-CoA reductase n=1 Tax=Favolaschia claudopus TaxID=2862362 RepID=A0AAW0B9D7_9AGAR
MTMDDPCAFFREQTILLTGGTGFLGACLLYKLTMKLDTQKIYAVVRGSTEAAISQWKKTMPEHIEVMLATKKIELILGDMTKHGFGIEQAILREMAGSVTVIIHAAANINWLSTIPLKESTSNNCLPVLGLAEAAATFEKLVKFVFISTTYANSFLPDGIVGEKIYAVGDAEQHLKQILSEGKVSEGVDSGFATPYTFAKHLAEQLLLSRNPGLPILIVRPSTVGPAISEPHPYYYRRGSCPGSDYIERYMSAPDSGIVHVSPHCPDGTNICDEIPVDIVANLTLLHIVHGTAGIVQAGAESYAKRTMAHFHQDIIDHFPRQDGARGPEFHYVTDKTIKQGRYAEFGKIWARDWHFSNAASKSFRSVKGPLSIALGDHDAAEKFMKERARRISEEVVRRRASKNSEQSS